MSEMEIKIEGMSCQHCVSSVTKALQAVPGVTDVKVSLEGKKAVVSGSADRAALVQAIVDTGFAVKE